MVYCDLEVMDLVLKYEILTTKYIIDPRKLFGKLLHVWFWGWFFFPSPPVFLCDTLAAKSDVLFPVVTKKQL